MDRSPGFGSYTRNSGAVHTRFPCGSGPEVLNLATHINSPDHSTKGTTSHVNVLCVLVNIRFQVLFHSPPGVLFTFPSQYFSAIGHWVVFRLGGWAPHIPYGLHVSVGTLDTDSRVCVSPTWLSHSPAGFPTPFGYAPAYTFLSEPRRYCYLRFSLFRFRSPLLAESRLISLPSGT